MQKQRNNLVFLKALRTFLFLGLALCVGMTAQAQGWNVRNIGVTAASEMGSVTFTPDGTGATLVSPPNGDIWNGSDKFTFGYKAVTGDGTITARLDSSDAVYTWSKTGVMIRQSLATNGAMVDCFLRPGNAGVHIQSWISSAVSDAGAASISAPVMLRLEKVGDQISAYYSTDEGANWLLVGAPLTMATTNPFYVGIAGCANSGPGPYTSVFSNIESTFDEAPFLPVPVVTPACQGNDTLYMGLFDPANLPATPAKKSFTLANTETGTTLTVSAVAATGTGYSIVAADLKKDGAAVTFPVTVVPGETLEVPVTFTPTTTEGIYLGTVTVTADVAIANINVAATVAELPTIPSRTG
jgi:hypothetical protein